MDHSQIQPTPGGDWKTSPHSHFAARLVEKPLAEEFHSPISARSGRIPDRAHTALDTTFSQPPPPAAADQVKCEVVDPRSQDCRVTPVRTTQDCSRTESHGHRQAEDHFHHGSDRAGRRPRRRGGTPARAPRQGARPRHQRHPLARPVGASRRSPATWKTPNRCGGESPGPTGSSTARPRWATGARSQNSAGSTSMPSGCCSTRPATLESSDSCTSARWASTRVATITAPTRPSRRRPILSTLTPAPRPRPRPWS